MKRIIPTLLTLIFVMACAGTTAKPSANEPTPDVAETSPNTNTAVPAQDGATATLTPEPTLTSTPEPPPTRWYWAQDSKTKALLAFDQYGEKREMGNLPANPQANLRSFPTGDGRAVAFTLADSQLHAYLLTIDGIQPIKLPADMPFNELSRKQWDVPAVYGDRLIFSYITDQSFGSRAAITADRGPLLLIDLKTLTASVLDTLVHHDVTTISEDTREWAHISEDGRYVRYLNGDDVELNLRELDLATGEVRTVHTVSGYETSRIAASLRGDMWLFAPDDLLIDLNGNQVDATDENNYLLPMRNGQAIILPRECSDNCEIQVVSPFSADAPLTYNLPWSSDGGFSPLMVHITPDKSLIFLASPTMYLAELPALAMDLPDLADEDEPVFRLTPDGEARIVGLYDFYLDRVPVSTDGHYLLLRSLDHASIFLYDTFADRKLVELPLLPDLDYFWATVSYYEDGVYVYIDASGPDKSYRSFYMLYSFLSERSYTWEIPGETLSGCVDLLADDTLICESMETESERTKLVHYDPATNESSVLFEDTWLGILPR